MKHAKLAPSCFKAYEACPSYLPDAETTKAAERGDMLHLIMKGNLKQCDANLDETDEHQLKMVQQYVQPLIDGAKQRHSKILREHEVDLTGLNISDCTHGTIDLLILDKKQRHAHLVDYKFGWWEVDDAEDNIQTSIYSLGVFSNHSWVDSVLVHILQPARDEVGTAIITRETTRGMLLRARAIANRVIKQAGKQFHPTLDHCLFCDRQGDCIKLNEFALKVRDLAHLDPERFGDLTAGSFNDLETSGDVYDFASVLERWASAIKYRITTMAQDGNDIPGHSLHEVNGKRSIIDQHGAYELLKSRFKVKLADYLTACEPSITKLMKLVRAKAPDKKKAVMEQEASNALMGEGMIAQGNPSAYLVRDKHKRKDQ